MTLALATLAEIGDISTYMFPDGTMGPIAAEKETLHKLQYTVNTPLLAQGCLPTTGHNLVHLIWPCMVIMVGLRRNHGEIYDLEQEAAVVIPGQWAHWPCVLGDRLPHSIPRHTWGSAWEDGWQKEWSTWHSGIKPHVLLGSSTCFMEFISKYTVRFYLHKQESIVLALVPVLFSADTKKLCWIPDNNQCTPSMKCPKIWAISNV